MDHKGKFVKYYFASFLFIVILIFIIAVFFIRSLKVGMEQVVNYYGYPTIFIFSLLSDAIMQPIGPDLVIISGIAIGLNVFNVLLIASAGSALASYLGFWLGKKYGKIGFINIFGKKKFEKTNKYYKKYGKYALLIATLTPVPYVPFCWASGIFNIKLRIFTYFGIIPRILRFTIIALIFLSIF